MYIPIREILIRIKKIKDFDGANLLLNIFLFINKN